MLTSLFFVSLLVPSTGVYEAIPAADLTDAIVYEEDGRMTFDLETEEAICFSTDANCEGSFLIIQGAEKDTAYLTGFTPSSGLFEPIATSSLHAAVEDGQLVFLSPEGDNIRVSDEEGDEGAGLIVPQF